MSGDCDVAVHSYKDLPTQPVDGLVVGAVPEREDPRDLLVTRDGHALGTLPELATVGTSSQRRSLQLLRARPGLRVRGIRGNLDTRLRKVADGEFDAVVVAHAGLRRLYVARSDGGVGPFDMPLTAVTLEPGECLPAPGQGALAVECRAGDERTLAVCRLLDDQATRRAVDAERAFLVRVGGGCLAPVGALARVVPEGLELRGMVGDPGTRRVARASLRGPAERAERLGRDLADRLVARGGGQLLAAVARLRAGGPGSAV
jgi:hydroxymethylbilane synthase